jgi:hypothetical protein
VTHFAPVINENVKETLQMSRIIDGEDEYDDDGL